MAASVASEGKDGVLVECGIGQALTAVCKWRSEVAELPSAWQSHAYELGLGAALSVGGYPRAFRGRHAQSGHAAGPGLLGWRDAGTYCRVAAGLAAVCGGQSRPAGELSERMPVRAGGFGARQTALAG